jgi:outer membrane protein, heavy metal efflux system
MDGSPPRRRLGRALAAGLAASVLAVPGARAAGPEAGDGRPLGATVDGLLAATRRLSPELAAGALDAEAAAARVEVAGALDDPMLRVTSDEDRDEHGRRLNKMVYGVEQEFPLWGKRELRRRVAEAEADGARARERAIALDLDERVKVAFARYYRAAQALRVERDVHDLLHAVGQAAQARYAQGLGGQPDAIRAGIERSRLALEQADLERDRREAEARLNALTARPAGAALAEPEALRPLPAADALRLDDLLERVRRGSPPLAAADADVAAAEGGRRLVERSWYPDLSLGASAIQREAGPAGYMLTAGLRLPLQWGLRRAQAREASARLGAARARQDGVLLGLRGDLEAALATLEAARRTEALLGSELAPQATAAYRSALTAYQLGRGDLAPVLEAAHQSQGVRLDLLAVQEREQTALAELERLAGGEL